MPAAGTTCLYRPIPGAFREVYARAGRDGVEFEFRAHWRTVQKWIAAWGEEHGEDDLKIARREYLEAHYQGQGKTGVPGRRPLLKSKAARYVMGRRLTAAKPEGEMCEEDA